MHRKLAAPLSGPLLHRGAARRTRRPRLLAHVRARLGPAWDAVTTPEAIHAFKLTVLIALIVVPANTVFGVTCALAIVRRRFPGKGIVNALVDLPLALSPIVVGLAFLLLYAQTGWFGSWLTEHGIQVVFALPGMVLVTIFVSLPFVVREVVPVLREIGTNRSRPRRRSAPRPPRPSGASPCRRSGGPWATASC